MRVQYVTRLTFYPRAVMSNFLLGEMWQGPFGKNTLSYYDVPLLYKYYTYVCEQQQDSQLTVFEKFKPAANSNLKTVINKV